MAKGGKKQRSIILIGQIVQRLSAAFALLGLLSIAIISIVLGNDQVHSDYVSVINTIGVGIMVIGLFSGLISTVIVSLVLSKTRKQQ